jgi:hypothetical protein
MMVMRWWWWWWWWGVGFQCLARRLGQEQRGRQAEPRQGQADRQVLGIAHRGRHHREAGSDEVGFRRQARADGSVEKDDGAGRRRRSTQRSGSGS